MLATRLCRCGYLDDAAMACGRAPKCALDYQGKISGPLYDRIDLHVDVPAVSAADLSLPQAGESSADVALRVAAARDRQAARFEALGGAHSLRLNVQADGELLEQIAAPDDMGRTLLNRAVEHMRLSARGYHRVLRVARTIADLADQDKVGSAHIAEALSFRRMHPVAAQTVA